MNILTNITNPEVIHIALHIDKVFLMNIALNLTLPIH